MCCKPKSVAKFFIATVLIVVSAFSSADEPGVDLLKAEKAVRLKQFSNAFSLYLNTARAGSAEAQYQLANLYLLGRGVAEDEQQGVRWLEESAAQSHAGAQYTLGLKLLASQPDRAIKLIQASSQQGYSPARAYLESQRPLPIAELNQDLSRTNLWFGAVRNQTANQLADILRGIDGVDIEDEFNRTALFVAIESDNEDAVRWLLDQGADPIHVDQFGFTPFFVAVKENQLDTLNLLFSKSKAATQTLPSGDNLLHYAVRLQKENIVASLIAKNISTNSANREGWTPLDLAEYAGLKNITSMLKTAGASHGTGWNRVGQKTAFERIAATWSANAEFAQLDRFELAKAVVAGNVPLAKHLLEKHPQWLNQKFDDQSTLLSMAVNSQQLAMVTALLQLSADANATITSGESALHVAARSGNVDIINALLQAGANPLQRSQFEVDAIAVAIQFGRDSAVQNLLLFTKTQQLSAPYSEYLLLAAKYDQTDLVHALLPQAATTAADELGRNALWYAAYHCNAAMVDRLLKSSLNFQQPDQFGKNAFLAAVEANCLSCAQQLNSANDVNEATINGHTALMMAANADQVETVQWLLGLGADIDARNAKGDTALIVAVRADAERAVKVLVDAGANVSRKNKLGFSALDLAKNNDKIQQMLKGKSVLGIF